MAKSKLAPNQFKRRDVVLATGISDERLNMWHSRGLIDDPAEAPGTGNHRLYSVTEVAMLAAIADLTGYGLPVSEAGRLMREAISKMPDYWRSVVERGAQDLFLCVHLYQGRAYAEFHAEIKQVPIFLTDDAPTGECVEGQPAEPTRSAAVFNIGHAVTTAVRALPQMTQEPLSSPTI